MLASTLAGCKAAAKSDGIPPLKTLAPWPIGTAVRDMHLNDADWTALAAQHFSRLTPEWEMKMEYILQPDGSLQLDRANRMAAFARENGMTLHGHTLVWYEQDGEYFQRLKDDRDAFLKAYTGYIQGVMTPYRGLATSWDVVNEPIMFEGEGIRPCLWRTVLGDDYIRLAYQAAREADPEADLFLNEYHLEHKPQKRRTFLKLCEDLLKVGTPLTGIGTQTHLSADIAPGMITESMRDIASLGLKVFISEVDISTLSDRKANMAQPRLGQIRALREIVEAYDQVPTAQQYGISFWGVRDSDSWLNGPKEGRGLDEPLLFDRRGRAKPLAGALVEALKG